MSFAITRIRHSYEWHEMVIKLDDVVKVMIESPQNELVKLSAIRFEREAKREAKREQDKRNAMERKRIIEETKQKQIEKEKRIKKEANEWREAEIKRHETDRQKREEERLRIHAENMKIDEERRKNALEEQFRERKNEVHKPISYRDVQRQEREKAFVRSGSKQLEEQEKRLEKEMWGDPDEAIPDQPSHRHFHSSASLLDTATSMIASRASQHISSIVSDHSQASLGLKGSFDPFVPSGVVPDPFLRYATMMHYALISPQLSHSIFSSRTSSQPQVSNAIYQLFRMHGSHHIPILKGHYSVLFLGACVLWNIGKRVRDRWISWICDRIEAEDKESNPKFEQGGKRRSSMSVRPSYCGDIEIPNPNDVRPSLILSLLPPAFRKLPTFLLYEIEREYIRRKRSSEEKPRSSTEPSKDDLPFIQSDLSETNTLFTKNKHIWDPIKSCPFMSSPFQATSAPASLDSSWCFSSLLDVGRSLSSIYQMSPSSPFPVNTLYVLYSVPLMYNVDLSKKGSKGKVGEEEEGVRKEDQCREREKDTRSHFVSRGAKEEEDYTIPSIDADLQHLEDQMFDLTDEMLKTEKKLLKSGWTTDDNTALQKSLASSLILSHFPHQCSVCVCEIKRQFQKDDVQWVQYLEAMKGMLVPGTICSVHIDSAALLDESTIFDLRHHKGKADVKLVCGVVICSADDIRISAGPSNRYPTLRVWILVEDYLLPEFSDTWKEKWANIWDTSRIYSKNAFASVINPNERVSPIYPVSLNNDTSKLGIFRCLRLSSPFDDYAQERLFRSSEQAILPFLTISSIFFPSPLTLAKVSTRSVSRQKWKLSGSGTGDEKIKKMCERSFYENDSIILFYELSLALLSPKSIEILTNEVVGAKRFIMDIWKSEREKEKEKEEEREKEKEKEEEREREKEKKSSEAEESDARVDELVLDTSVKVTKGIDEVPTVCICVCDMCSDDDIQLISDSLSISGTLDQCSIIRASEWHPGIKEDIRIIHGVTSLEQHCFDELSASCANCMLIIRNSSPLQMPKKYYDKQHVFARPFDDLIAMKISDAKRVELSKTILCASRIIIESSPFICFFLEPYFGIPLNVSWKEFISKLFNSVIETNTKKIDKHKYIDSKMWRVKRVTSFRDLVLLLTILCLKLLKDHEQIGMVGVSNIGQLSLFPAIYNRVEQFSFPLSSGMFKYVVIGELKEPVLIHRIMCASEMAFLYDPDDTLKEDMKISTINLSECRTEALMLAELEKKEEMSRLQSSATATGDGGFVPVQKAAAPVRKKTKRIRRKYER
ncbi:hypothetical protein ADUPG1_012018 [Aduncisulcus paluster]|uniref:Uncharacterized protein n=1 Tax=Aduncisulcus paluster TaxID=2918883 RepID=A0ABQ5JZU6_9EUKA|nr:hypothetical protein ADUPG1_012018 [Aduncisulcus paluster]